MNGGVLRLYVVLLCTLAFQHESISFCCVGLKLAAMGFRSFLFVIWCALLCGMWCVFLCALPFKLLNFNFLSNYLTTCNQLLNSHHPISPT